MDKRRVLLVCSQTLFGESLETLLHNVEGIEVVAVLEFDDATPDRIVQVAPDVVIIVDNPPERDAITHLAVALAEHFPNLHIIQTGLEQSTLRVFTAQTWPASSMDLINVIRNTLTGMEL